MEKDKKCKVCRAPLRGEMIFYPEVCLSSVISHEGKCKFTKLKKWKK